MVLGIGPRATLEGLDIPIIADVPGVGQNMWAPDRTDYSSRTPLFAQSSASTGLTEIRDQEVAVAGFTQAPAVFRNNATTAIILGPEALPDLNVSSNAQILDFIQQSAAASYRASATCAISVANGSLAAPDSKARVYGVRGLHEVDASAAPVLPPGHPSSTICK
ncbi:hypothetical protein MMC08_002453 [Hypocenomyce scalaris]|nr:hypothetical protein [Hypocenomyce scalaris]